MHAISSSSTNQGPNATRFEIRRTERKEILRVAEEQRQELLKGLEDDEREMMELNERRRDVKNSLRSTREELERDLANERDTLRALTSFLIAGRAGGLSDAECGHRICLALERAELVERMMDLELNDEDIRRRMAILEGRLREEREKVEALELDLQTAARLFGLGDAEGSASQSSGSSGGSEGNDEMK
ncbi:hypothetical protein EYR38_002011 [Pleurotus pulmonarius]|nr:hypothetical protein EYR38_002011 [Pleurotus pulmonarius]